MRNIKIITLVLDISERLKPLLVKLFSISFLRSIKKRLVDSSMTTLESSKAPLPFSRDAYPDGINLIGYVKAEIGLGESCRLIAGVLENTDLDFTVYNYEIVGALRYNDTTWKCKITNTVPYNINLIHIQPYELSLAYIRMDKKIWDKRYNIAFWLWELEQFPESWKKALILADEIWTPSEFVSASIRSVTDKPVHTIQYGIDTPPCGEYTRDSFTLPDDKFLVLCMYDCNSFIERKNPIATIRAYKQAFSPHEQDVGIVIKLNNPQKADIQAIEAELSEYSNVYLIAEVLEKTQVNALIACADIYISLHRSEGFGLIPAEAMLLGTPVIATNWSANTEFMTKDTACLVDFAFITIEKDQGPYKAGNRWADPDIGQAAGYLRKLYEDEKFRRLIADNAREYIKEKLSPERAVALMKQRIIEIYNTAT